MRIIRSPYSQTGHGVGSIFRSLARVFVPVARTVFRASKPMVKKAVKIAGKEALQVGLDTLGDIAQGQNVQSSLKKNIRAGSKRALDQGKESVKAKGMKLLSQGIKGSGKSAQAHSVSKPAKSKKKKKIKKTIFD